MKTVHFLAFYLHNLPKITFFAPWSSMNPKNTKSLHFDGDGWGWSALSHFFRWAISLLQMRNQFSSDFHFHIFEFLLLLLWWFTPVFTMICSCFYDEVVQYRLNPHGYSFDFVSDVDCNSFLPRIQNFQARKIIVSSRENFTLNTRIHFILYRNTLHSRKECSWFSYWK